MSLNASIESNVAFCLQPTSNTFIDLTIEAFRIDCCNLYHMNECLGRTDSEGFVSEQVVDVPYHRDRFDE